MIGVGRRRFIGDVVRSELLDRMEYGVWGGSGKSWMKREMFDEVSCKMVNR